MLDVALRVDRPRFAVEVAFALAEGERLGCFGPSGSGKSTILDAVAGLVPLQAGRVLLEGRDLSEVALWQRRVGLVRQRPALFPHLSVADNVRYGAPGRRGANEAAAEAELCERLGIGQLLGHRPGQLSGGQRQRVALARALRARFKVLLLDEPFQGLDAPVRQELVALVRDLLEARGVPAVLVSHDLDEVQAFARRLGVLDEGHLLQVGHPAELVRRPATARVATLVGYTVVADQGRQGELLGLHPSLVRLGSFPEAGPVLTGVVRVVRPHGPLDLVEVELARGVVFGVPCDPAEAGRVGEVACAPGAQVELTAVRAPRFSSEGTLLGDGLAPDEPLVPVLRARP